MYFQQKDHVCKYELCRENFTSPRTDAAFCSTRCRTAHHRLMKKREAAHEAILVNWEGDALIAYQAIWEESADSANQIKDIYTKDTDSAEQTAVIIYAMMSHVQKRLQRTITSKDREIERLQADADKLKELKSYVRQL